MRISEIFFSVQGEGKLLGVPSVFIRASGCNLRCAWCDTPYASWDPRGQEMPLNRIIEEVKAYPARHAVVTGGEPMIMPEIALLCQELKQLDLHVTVETAATLYLPVALDLASLSPKLANSTPTERDGGRFAAVHDKHRLNLTVIQKFIDASPDFQLKFVLSSERDLVEIEQVLGGLRHWKPDDVLLMPEGIDPEILQRRSAWVAELCKRTGFRFCPRLHIALYGNRRGT